MASARVGLGGRGGGGGAMSSEQLERGLQASVKIYALVQSKLDAAGDAGDAGEVGEVGAVSREELVTMKRASAAMNRALTALVRESHDAQNRLTLELHMLRGIMQREHTDREANRAQVFELFPAGSGEGFRAARGWRPPAGWHPRARGCGSARLKKTLQD